MNIVMNIQDQIHHRSKLLWPKTNLALPPLEAILGPCKWMVMQSDISVYFCYHKCIFSWWKNHKIHTHFLHCPVVVITLSSSSMGEQSIEKCAIQYDHEYNYQEGNWMVIYMFAQWTGWCYRYQYVWSGVSLEIALLRNLGFVGKMILM